MEMAMVKELLLQSLEHEKGGVKVYETALKCVINEDLKEEWEKYHQETEHHVQVLQDVCSQMQLDPEELTPGRKIVHDMGVPLNCPNTVCVTDPDARISPSPKSTR